MNEVKRYKWWADGMDTHPEGDYVSYDDYEKARDAANQRHICEECELPIDSEPHLQHCPEAIRG